MLQSDRQNRLRGSNDENRSLPEFVTHGSVVVVYFRRIKSWYWSLINDGSSSMSSVVILRFKFAKRVAVVDC